jgi:hypothetical protein
MVLRHLRPLLMVGFIEGKRITFIEEVRVGYIG